MGIHSRTKGWFAPHPNGAVGALFEMKGDMERTNTQCMRFVSISSQINHTKRETGENGGLNDNILISSGATMAL